MQKKTNETKRIMKSVLRRLDKFENQTATACGHDIYLAECDKTREGLLTFIANEVDVLARKAGLK